MGTRRSERAGVGLAPRRPHRTRRRAGEPGDRVSALRGGRPAHSHGRPHGGRRDAERVPRGRGLQGRPRFEPDARRRRQPGLRAGRGGPRSREPDRVRGGVRGAPPVLHRGAPTHGGAGSALLLLAPHRGPAAGAGRGRQRDRARSDDDSRGGKGHGPAPGRDLRRRALRRHRSRGCPGVPLHSAPGRDGHDRERRTGRPSERLRGGEAGAGVRGGAFHARIHRDHAQPRGPSRTRRPPPVARLRRRHGLEPALRRGGVRTHGTRGVLSPQRQPRRDPAGAALERAFLPASGPRDRAAGPFKFHALRIYRGPRDGEGGRAALAVARARRSDLAGLRDQRCGSDVQRGPAHGRGRHRDPRDDPDRVCSRLAGRPHLGEFMELRRRAHRDDARGPGDRDVAQLPAHDARGRIPPPRAQRPPHARRSPHGDARALASGCRARHRPLLPDRLPAHGVLRTGRDRWVGVRGEGCAHAAPGVRAAT